MNMKKNEKNVKRGEIYWVVLDPTIGTETKKTRPAVIISNDAQNKVGQRYIVAPITSVVKNVYPFEVKIDMNGTPSKIMVDQIRTIAYQRLGTKLAKVSAEELVQIERAIKVVLHLA
ncbi:MAG: plasmid maintenance protein [Alphaproteobacteria bacterium]|jgi:mRNA interferase MazF|nr:plasmid maintenance protein [Alphaproteobacteria bacterium]